MAIVPSWHQKHRFVLGSCKTVIAISSVSNNTGLLGLIVPFGGSRPMMAPGGPSAEERCANSDADASARSASLPSDLQMPISLEQHMHDMRRAPLGTAGPCADNETRAGGERGRVFEDTTAVPASLADSTKR